MGVASGWRVGRTWVGVGTGSGGSLGWATRVASQSRMVKVGGITAMGDAWRVGVGVAGSRVGRTRGSFGVGVRVGRTTGRSGNCVGRTRGTCVAMMRVGNGKAGATKRGVRVGTGNAAIGLAVGGNGVAVGGGGGVGVDGWVGGATRATGDAAGAGGGGGGAVVAVGGRGDSVAAAMTTVGTGVTVGAACVATSRRLAVATVGLLAMPAIGVPRVRSSASPKRV